MPADSSSTESEQDCAQIHASRLNERSAINVFICLLNAVHDIDDFLVYHSILDLECVHVCSYIPKYATNVILISVCHGTTSGEIATGVGTSRGWRNKLIGSR